MVAAVLLIVLVAVGSTSHLTRVEVKCFLGVGNVTIITPLTIGSLKISVIRQAFLTTDKRTAIDKVARILKISDVYLAVHYISDVFVDLV